MGVVAPSGVVDSERLRTGAEILRGWGFEVRLAPHVEARQTYLAGSDQERLDDLVRMLDDPSVRAVFCARGGFGVQRLVPALSLDGFCANPKLVVGFSDATALLARLLTAGVPAIHGPMIATDIARGLTVAAQDHLVRLLTDPGYRWELPVPETVRGGSAEGVLVGGCLSVLASTLGTPWAPDVGGRILFLEDVHEPPYRIDRLLTQLRQAGLFDRVAGVVVGTLAGCPIVDGVMPRDVVRACFAGARYPVGIGLAAGHDPALTGVENYALPLGVRVRLDTNRHRIVALEAPVARP